ncbi:hypothetical protein G7046_g1873 [Stylonectria norvegica]|nr:hypothetical protein G7046_g1873 [Stylonectria norvegica]
MEGIDTNITSTVHKESYLAISPTRPELSKIGRTVLITGGSAGIGKAIARNFVSASAANVIILARREDVLKSAALELEQHARNIKSPSKIITRSCDVTKHDELAKLWADFTTTRYVVDTLVLNAVKGTEPKSLFELGTEEVWAQFEANVKGPLLLAEQFYKQGTEGQKYLVNISTQAINMFQVPIIAARPAYSLTKAAGTLAAQLIANSVTPDKLQVISFHPGLIYSEPWVKAGVARDALPFDSEDLPGSFAVWAASKEAEFLHGRFAWASWDVEELATQVAESIEDNPEYLRIGVLGLNENPFQFVSVYNPASDDAQDRKAKRLARSHAVVRGLENKRKLQQMSGANFREARCPIHLTQVASKIEPGRPLKSPCPFTGMFQMLAAQSPRLQELLGYHKAREATEAVFTLSDELVLQNFRSVLRKGVNDHALLNAVMLTFAFSVTAGDIDDKCIGYQSQALSSIRQRMSSPGEAASECTIGAILLLAGVEARLGMPQRVELHMGAVRQLLDMCREKSVFLTDGIKRAIFWYGATQVPKILYLWQFIGKI